MKKLSSAQIAARIAGFGLALSVLFHIASFFGFDMMRYPALFLPLVVGIILLFIPAVIRQEKTLESRSEFLKVRLQQTPLLMKYSLYLLWTYIALTDIIFFYQTGAFSDLPKGSVKVSDAVESLYDTSGFMAFYSLFMLYYGFFPQRHNVKKENQ